jgi:hypothetical protein
VKTFLIVLSLANPRAAPESIKEMPGALSCRIAVAQLRAAAEDSARARCVVARKDYD